MLGFPTNKHEILVLNIIAYFIPNRSYNQNNLDIHSFLSQLKLLIGSRIQYIIPAKPLHYCDIVSVHFNHFYCMGICDKLTKHLSMLTYIYLNVDECWLTSSMP